MPKPKKVASKEKGTKFPAKRGAPFAESAAARRKRMAEEKEVKAKGRSR